MKPIFNEKNEIIEILSLMRDVSDEVDFANERASLIMKEKLSRESYEKLKSITDVYPIVVLQFSLDYSITFLDEATENWYKTILKRDCGIGTNFIDTLPPTGKEFVLRHVEEMRRTKVKKSFEQAFQDIPNASGEMGIHACGLFVPLFDKDGEVSEVMLILRDISEERKAADEHAALVLKEKMSSESSKQKSEFLVHMSHELRTPLTGLLGLMEHLFSSVSLNTEQHLLAEEAVQSGEMLLMIINDILDLSKIEAGKLEIEMHDFGMIDLVDQSCGLVKHSLEKNGVLLIAHVDRLLEGTFCGDILRLKQMILNLLSNAIKFSRKNPIALTVQEAHFVPSPEEVGHKMITFSIIDQGIGIPCETQAQLFQAFNQADISTQRKYGGTGLGLSICQKLVTLMNGTISCDSKEGIGSRFWFSLPLRPVSLDVKSLAMSEISIHSENELIKNQLELAVQNRFTPTECLRSIITHEGKRIKVELKNGKSEKVFFNNPFYTWEIHYAMLKDSSSVKRHTEKSVSPFPLRKLMKFDTSKKVLVVDDNCLNRKVLCMILSKIGVGYICASDGNEAIEMWRKFSDIDLIFMDCLMPGMDGYQCTKIIRAEERGGKRVPIIAITANSLKEDEEKCLEIGMDAYLTKPFQIEKVNATLKKFFK
jgi:signal transduction histidine kinase/CheY-like chemotaxis protein